MLRGLFGNMPEVTKNLLIINLLFFLAMIVMEGQGIDLNKILGLHYPASEDFQPYQIATHFFMHANLMHIFFNMFALVVFGSHLERMWGPKRYLMFYFATAIGAAVLHMAVQGYEIYRWTGTFNPDVSIHDIDFSSLGEMKAAIQMYIPTVGASGAVYGLIAGFAMLFPNTQLMLYFAIPVKAKYFALGLAAIALYMGYRNAAGDSVAHFAHLGGMLIGFIIVKIWQRDKNRFY